MTLKITIDMDNAAFDDSAGAETARILKDIARKMEDCVYETSAWNATLRDINGNKVGKAAIV